MGCFGTTVHFGSFSPPPAVPFGDVDGDGRVTVQDLLLVVSHTARKNYDARYDINHDGRINAAYMTIVFLFGATGSVIGSASVAAGGWALTSLIGAAFGGVGLVLFLVFDRPNRTNRQG